MTKGKIALITGCSLAAATVIIVPTTIAIVQNANKTTPIITKAGNVVVGLRDEQVVDAVVSFNWNSAETPDYRSFEAEGHTLTAAGPVDLNITSFEIQPERSWLGILISFDETAEPFSIYNLSFEFDFKINDVPYHYDFDDIQLYVVDR